MNGTDPKNKKQAPEAGAPDGPCWVVDFLPRRVPAKGGGRFFAVEDLWLGGPRGKELREAFAEIVLKLYCYEDLEVLVCGRSGTECLENPDPAVLEDLLPANENDLVVRIKNKSASLALWTDSTHMEVRSPTKDLLRLLRALASSRGLFVWRSPGG